MKIMSFDPKTVHLEWLGDHPGTEIEALVREDIAVSLADLPSPASLVTHSV